MTLRFAIDTGGTFTDLVVADGSANDALTMFKVPTTPADPVLGVIDSLRVAAETARVPLAAYLARGEMLVHGTTHAINAVITRATARTAFLTTMGHPDTLVFREGGRIEPFNFTVPYPEPFVPKALTFEVPERVLADGSVRVPLDETAVVAMLQRLAVLRVEAVAVCLLWSIVNSAHEERIAALIERHLPGVPYTLSHRVNPSVREYRRAISTCLDAALKPLMGDYMRGLEQRLRDAGFAGRVLVVTSLGGVIDAAEAARTPVQLLNSGPSMAPIAARAYADGDPALIVGDTGGTTFDVSVVRNGRIPRTRETWLGQRFRSDMTGMPSVDVRSIGAGGGSIAFVDAGGLLHVGPRSAGAVPGPACYGRGGTDPTVTDAALLLGYIDAGFFLGGRMRLERAAADAALLRAVAQPLGCSVEAAALAVMELATEHMVQAILDITVNQGLDPGGGTFVAGGGAAGLNAVAIGRRLGCRRVLVPETGAALSAGGALLSDLTAHYQAMFHTNTNRFDLEGVNDVLTRLAARCRGFADSSGAGALATHVGWVVEARYPDQAWEIEVPLQRARFDSDADVQALVADFHAAHEALFAISDIQSPVETVGWNAELHCRVGSGVPGRLLAVEATGALPHRRVRFAGTGWIDTAVHRFEALDRDSVIAGPAIVESGFTSVVLDPRTRTTRDAFGSLVIELHETAGSA